MLKLVAPTMLPVTGLEKYVQEFAGSAIHGADCLRKHGAHIYLEHRDWMNYPSNFNFFTLNELDQIVGNIRLSLVVDEQSVRSGAYNIGYSIRPSMRGRGYGKEQLKLGLLWLKAYSLTGTARLAANVDNVASNRTAQACGGILVCTRADNLNVYEFDLFNLNLWHQPERNVGHADVCSTTNAPPQHSGYGG